MVKGNKAQSILEYLLFLIMVVAAVFIGAEFLKQGVQGGLNRTQDFIRNSFPGALNGG